MQDSLVNAHCFALETVLTISYANIHSDLGIRLLTMFFQMLVFEHGLVGESYPSYISRMEFSHIEPVAFVFELDN
jgi:hypothetical protein